jgi:hypothetical protein
MCPFSVVKDTVYLVPIFNPSASKSLVISNVPSPLVSTPPVEVKIIAQVLSLISINFILSAEKSFVVPPEFVTPVTVNFSVSVLSDNIILAVALSNGLSSSVAALTIVDAINIVIIVIKANT